MEEERREEGGKGGRGQGEYRGMELKLETAGGWGGLVRTVRYALRFARVPAILLCHLKIRFLYGRPDGATLLPPFPELFLGSTCSAFVLQTTLGYAVHSKAVPHCCYRCFAFQLL